MKSFHVRRGTHWMVVSLFLAVAGCGGDSGTNGGGDGGGDGTPVITASVTVQDFEFVAPSIQVSPGATVTWTWAGGGALHNVTFASSAVAAASDTQTTGTFQVTMPTAPGAYTYQCTVHPSLMNATVTVQ